MTVKLIISFLLCFMCSSVCAQIPYGTVRVIPGYGGTESYYGQRGEYLGRSTPNNQGGRTYNNQYQYSTRSYRMYNGGQRFVPTTGPLNRSGVYNNSRYHNHNHFKGGYGAFNKPSSRVR